MLMITESKLQEIYEAVKTPYKYGAVIKCDGVLNDSPVVFRDGDKWYMSYIEIDAACKTGYRTFLAESDDLIHFRRVTEILTEKCDWDKSQCGGYAQMIDNTFGGDNRIRKIDGKYVFAFIGGCLNGYETDPLSLGLCTAAVLTDDTTYRKQPKPILSGSDADAREGETLTIYKPAMFEDPEMTLGHRYVCCYNAKGPNHRESIYLAVSDDGICWKRYGDHAVIDIRDSADSVRINGDPQIVRMMDVYVMFYFVHEPGVNTYNTFAVSEDLLHWTKWRGKPLVEREYPWEDVYAHKQWILKHDDVVYHYYCAVNSKKERFIALATSKQILSEE